jgi:hypothetical protein
MKRILFAMVIILLMAIEAKGNTTTLTGVITDAQGNPVNGTLILQLPVPAQDISTNRAISNTPVVYRLINGVVTGNTPLIDVANLQPSNLYYITKAYDTAGTPVFAGNYAITGASYNLGAATPTTITTSNISYLSPASTSGPNTFCNPNPGCTQTFNGQIISIVNTGTPPFIVTSTTLVPNLNVGTWDGITCSGVPTANQVPVALNGTTCSWQPDPGVLSAITNNTSAGTVAGLISKLTGAPSTATPVTVADTGGAIGICISSCGNSGTGSFSTVGVVPCTFDGATTAGDYVKISSSVAGNCNDAGATYPTGQIIGRVLSTNGAGGSYNIIAFGAEQQRSGVAVGAFCNAAISNGVSLTGSPQTIATCSITTPSAGCPCRALFNYATTIVKVGAGTGVAIYVNSSVADSGSATKFASSAAGESNASTGGAAEVGATSYSFGTFNNSTSITFTLIAQNATGSYTLNSSPLAGSGPTMTFQVAMQPSN